MTKEIKQSTKHMYTYFKKNPWARHYSAAAWKCNSKKSAYNKRGIKLEMNTADFKYLWFRDKAWLLEKPSVDRIDGRKNYSLDNCRFIEWEENKHGPHLAQRKRIIQYTKKGKKIKEWLGIIATGAALNINYPNIVSCLKGRRNMAGGFKWKYAKS